MNICSLSLLGILLSFIEQVCKSVTLYMRWLYMDKIWINALDLSWYQRMSEVIILNKILDIIIPR